MMAWLNGRRTVDVPCTVEIEQTSESLHAHVVLDTGFSLERDPASDFGSRPARHQRPRSR